MRAALALARRSLGRTWPNPAVGCVLVQGRPRHRARPYAGRRSSSCRGGRARSTPERRRAARQSTSRLSLARIFGKSPPCADALVRAGVSRVVSAMEDPNPPVNGRGHARLKEAGIAVEVGEGAREAAEINAGFLLRLRAGRPLFHLKLASSLDGRIATASGESKWITGEGARADGHRLRATHDAILVGSGTVAADDPELTCRLPGLAAYSPLRIVLDSRARLSPASKLAQTARAWRRSGCCARLRRPRRRAAALRARGVEIVEVAAGGDGRVDVAAAAQALGERGLTRVLVEGGGEVAAAFLKAGLVDRISSYRAGLVLGGDGRSAVGRIGLQPARFRAPVQAGFGAFVGRRHAGNLDQTDLRTNHVHRHRDRHWRDHRRHSRRPGRRPPLRRSHPARHGADRHRRVDRLLGLLPHRAREGQRLVRCRSLGREPRQDPSRRLESRAAVSTSNSRSSWATSWAAISSTAMSMALARSSR